MNFKIYIIKPRININIYYKELLLYINYGGKYNEK